jgi:hypothetical protein
LLFRKLKSGILNSLNVYSILALAGMIGPVFLGAADLAAGITSPGYNPARDSISSLALTPNGWLQTIGFLVLGLLVELFAAGLLFSIRSKRGFRFGIAILVWFGFELLLLGAFRTDPAGSVSTRDGIIHGLAAKTVFWLFPFVCLLIAKSLKYDAAWKDLYKYNYIVGALALVLTFAGIWLIDGFAWFGLYERLLVYNVIIWLEVMALRVLILSIHRGRMKFKMAPLYETDNSKSGAA